MAEKNSRDRDYRSSRQDRHDTAEKYTKHSSSHSRVSHDRADDKGRDKKEKKERKDKKDKKDKKEHKDEKKARRSKKELYTWILDQDATYVMTHHPLVMKLHQDSLTNFVPPPEPVPTEGALQPQGTAVPPATPAPVIKAKPNYFTTGLLLLENIPSATKGGLQGVSFTPDGQLVVAPTASVSGAPAVNAAGVVVTGTLYKEPSEARVPTDKWRLYHFPPGKDKPEPVPLHRKSCFKLGRNAELVDLVIPDASASGVHAVVQFRVTEAKKDGHTVPLVKPYLMDLGSTNGTFFKSGTGAPKRLDKLKYYELLDKDVVLFGAYKGEFVFMKTQ